MELFFRHRDEEVFEEFEDWFSEVSEENADVAFLDLRNLNIFHWIAMNLRLSSLEFSILRPTTT